MSAARPRIRRCCSVCRRWEILDGHHHRVAAVDTWAGALRELIHRQKLGLL